MDSGDSIFKASALSCNFKALEDTRLASTCCLVLYPVLEGQRRQINGHLHCLFLYQGMECLLQVAVPEKIGISADYQW